MKGRTSFTRGVVGITLIALSLASGAAVGCGDKVRGDKSHGVGLPEDEPVVPTYARLDPADGMPPFMAPVHTPEPPAVLKARSQHGKPSTPRRGR